MQAPHVFAMFGCVMAASPNVMYFRNHNMDRSYPLVAPTTATSVTLNEWDTTINNFDTVADVTVQRIDLVGSPSATVSLYSEKAPLQLPNGPIYFFHNSTELTILGEAKNYSASKTDAVLWISKSSCVTLLVTLSPAGEASLLAVTSGKVNWTATDAEQATCGAMDVIIGAGVKQASGSGGSFYYNEKSYSLNNSASCTSPLTHGHNGYSQTDEPIGPLAAHFHTRGTLYYNQYGTSKYNDEAAPYDTLYQGELRFVNQGVYYGPEEMDQSTSFVASVHESDPAALVTVSENPESECPFACMNTIGSTPTAQCTKATKIMV